MSDTAYQVYQHYGTNAQRLAFTPNPPTGYQPIYIWFETDTGNTYIYTTAWHVLSFAQSSQQISLVVDGGGSPITTGIKGFIQVFTSCTIQGWTILSIDAAGPATSGSIVFDIWKVPFASYPPTVANTIVASAPPTLSSAKSATSSTLTGWTTAINAGDVLGFNVNSLTAVLKVILQLKVSIP